MRILMSSHFFAPSIGGLESASLLLASELAARGHELRLITQSPRHAPDRYPFAVLRQPSGRQLLRLVRWCELYFHNNISLARAWPLLLLRRPWVVAHHVWIPPSSAAGRLKRAALRHATGIAVSAAVARDLATPATVIPNAYDDALFRELPGSERRHDIVFVGRLVSDKGVDLLIEALALLAAGGLRPDLTIVGSGPEAPRLRGLAQAHGLQGQICFAGSCRGEELVGLLNDHKLIAIPSRWNEPFGMVALEGMACGCVPVASSGGGLPEAIGDSGVSFANGDVPGLAQRLAQLLADPLRQQQLRQRAREHLRRHTRARVADQYLAVFRRALAREPPLLGEQAEARDA